VPALPGVANRSSHFRVQLSISNLEPAIFPRQISREENKFFQGKQFLQSK
jgi:hypothetical protein